MILEIQGKIFDGDKFRVSVDDKTAEIDSVETVAIFDVTANREYHITISLVPPKSNRSILHILLFIFTALLQGLFNVLLMNTNANWFTNINAYIFSANFQIKPQQNNIINFSYTKSQYNEKTSTFFMPEFNCSIKNSNLLFMPNKEGIKNEFFNYVKRVISIDFIVLIIIILLLFISIINNILVSIIICAMLILGAVLFPCFVISLQYKKCKQILKNI